MHQLQTKGRATEAVMDQKPEYQELEQRIQEHLAVCQNPTLLEDASIAWGGYVAALLEWGLIPIEDHRKLNDLLPKLSRTDPVMPIFLGVDSDED